MREQLIALVDPRHRNGALRLGLLFAALIFVPFLGASGLTSTPNCIADPSGECRRVWEDPGSLLVQYM